MAVVVARAVELLPHQLAGALNMQVAVAAVLVC